MPDPISAFFGLPEELPGGTTRSRSKKALRKLHDDPDVLIERMAGAEPEREVPWYDNTYYKRRKSVDGVEYDFYTFGAMCEAIQMRPQTIRLWERQGRWPRATVRVGKSRKGEHLPRDERNHEAPGDRLYTRWQIDEIVAACLRHGQSLGTIRPSSPLFDELEQILESLEGAP